MGIVECIDKQDTIQNKTYTQKRKHHIVNEQNCATIMFIKCIARNAQERRFTILMIAMPK